MKKVVVNRCFGGFGLSHKAVMRYAEIKGIQLYAYSYTIIDGEITPIPYSGVGHPFCILYFTEPLNDDGSIPEGSHFDDPEREDPILIQVIEELGSEANGDFANLEIVEIPDDVEYEIEQYDGSETIAEVHRTW